MEDEPPALSNLTQTPSAFWGQAGTCKHAKRLDTARAPSMLLAMSWEHGDRFTSPQTCIHLGALAHGDANPQQPDVVSPNPAACQQTGSRHELTRVCVL